MGYTIVKGLDIKLAYRIDNNRVTYNELGLRRKAYVPRSKTVISTSYVSNYNKWQVDLSAQIIGNKRLPEAHHDPEQSAHLRHLSQSPVFTLVNAQVTRRFLKYEGYLGVENALNFKQHEPIIFANQPFGDKFDATMIWGPINGSMFHIGLRKRI